MATSTVTQTSDIPKILEPFYLGREGQPGLLERGISEIFPTGATSPQGAYDTRYADLINQGLMGAGSIAGLTQSQLQLGQSIDALRTPGAFDAAQQFGQTAGQGLSGLQNLQAMSVSAPELSQYQIADPTQYSAPLMEAAQMQGPQMFGSEQAQQYMSPYMQGVVDVQQRKAIDAARQSQLGANLGAARTGTFGGARQAVLQGSREAGLRQEMGDIQAKGLQDAFTQAQQQFERDRASSMQAQLANLNAAQQAAVQNQAAQLQTQGLNAQQAMQVALANQQSSLGVQQLGAGQNLEAQRANQAAELQAAQTSLGANQALAGLAGTMGGLGTQQLAGEIDILKTRGAYGDLERNIEQQQIDARRNDALTRANYGMTQIGDLSNLLRGTPLTDTRQVSTTPPPSFASQLSGMGLATLGMYNMSNPQQARP